MRNADEIARGICNNLLAWLDERNIPLTDEQFEDYGDEIDKALREYGEAEYMRGRIEAMRDAKKIVEGKCS